MGAHFYFRLPDDLPAKNLKNHVCHPLDPDGVKRPMDWKFGPRTLLVAPGTLRKGNRYEPQTPWFNPAEVDPRLFLRDGKFWKEERLFAVDERPLKSRFFRARNYLRNQAPVSVSEEGGRRVLRSVATHLIVFLGLDPALAFHLMTHAVGGGLPWNERCRYSNGSPYPWDLHTLYLACERAVDGVPEAGVKEYGRRLERESCRERLRIFVERVVQCRMAGSAFLSTRNLLERFEAWSGQRTSAEILTPMLLEAGFQRYRYGRQKVRGFLGIDAFRLGMCLKKGVLQRSA